MKNFQKRFINRLIARIYLITNSGKTRLFLLNFFTKNLIDKGNSIEYDSVEDLFWYKNGDQFLPPQKSPNFDFKVNRFDENARDFMCKKYLPKKGDIIIDLGAGVGEEIYFFSKRIQQTGVLYSIEASPNNFSYLQKLTNKHGFTNCRNYNIAISNFNGKIAIQEDDFYLLKKVGKNINGVEVPCFTLDSFVENNNIQRIDLLKVNIEGSEYEMIEGMHKSLNIIENVAVSCHDFLHLPGKKGIKEKLIQFFEKNNFKVSLNQTGNMVEDSWIYAANSKNRF